MTLLAIWDALSSANYIVAGAYRAFESRQSADYRIPLTTCMPLPWLALFTVVGGQLAHVAVCADRSECRCITLTAKCRRSAGRYCAIAMPTRYRKWKHAKITVAVAIAITACSFACASLILVVSNVISCNSQR